MRSGYSAPVIAPTVPLAKDNTRLACKSSSNIQEIMNEIKSISALASFPRPADSLFSRPRNPRFGFFESHKNEGIRERSTANRLNNFRLSDTIQGTVRMHSSPHPQNRQGFSCRPNTGGPASSNQRLNLLGLSRPLLGVSQP
jgi:hypothetical protein